MTSVGERLKRTRLAQGFSQTQLAAASEVSQPTVANWENNSHVPRQHVLNRLAGILEISPYWLLSGEDSNNDYALTPKPYLTTPIQHVPIQTWPTADRISGHKFELGSPHDYLAISTKAKSPFALIANDPAMADHFPIGAVIIFDSQPGPIEEASCYLFLIDGKITLRRWQTAPNRLEALPNQSTVDAIFISEVPVPLAKALISVRRH